MPIWYGGAYVIYSEKEKQKYSQQLCFMQIFLKDCAVKTKLAIKNSK